MLLAPSLLTSRRPELVHVCPASNFSAQSLVDSGSGWLREDNYTIEPGADLRGVDLMYANLAGAFLTDRARITDDSLHGGQTSRSAAPANEAETP